MIEACFHDGGNIRLCNRDYDGGMATSIDQKNFVKTALRLPPELHASVHEAAQKSGRSYNAELVERIQGSFSPEAADPKRIAKLEAEIAAERVRSDHLKIAADSSNDVRTLLATILLSTLDRLPEDPTREESDRRLVRSLVQWLGERDQRGAVHSILRLIDGADSEKVEMLRGLAAQLEEMDDREHATERSASVNRIIIVGNLGRLLDAREERFGLLGGADLSAPKAKQYGPKRSGNARKPKP